MPLCFAMGPRRPKLGGLGFGFRTLIWFQVVAGFFRVQLEMVVEFWELEQLGTTFNGALDILAILGRDGARGGVVSFYDKLRVPLCVECFYVLRGCERLGS